MMLSIRAVLAVAMIVVGGVVLVRVLAYGVRVETISGIVLGAAMIALGAHRIALIVRARGAA